MNDDFTSSDFALACVYYSDAYRNRSAIRGDMDREMTSAERQKAARELDFLDMEILATLRTGPWHGGAECPI